MTTDSLQRKVQFYQEEVEPWKVEHDEVMDRYEAADGLADVIKTGLFIYNRFKESPTTKTFNEAICLYESYLRWHELSTLIIRAIELIQTHGFEVAGFEKFVGCFHEATSLIERFRGRITALNFFIEGSGIPSDVFIQSLRDQHSA